MKSYDREYFDRWYREPSTRVVTKGELRRKVALAIAVTEFFVRRPIENVLDVGCGEAPWRRELQHSRPEVDYTGVDPSDYVVERYGRARNIVKASFAGVTDLGLEPGFDLVVCSDVMHYISDDELIRGLPTLAALADGVAYLDVLTADDEIVGDLDGFIRRPADWYRAQFEAAGFVFAGPHCWLSPSIQTGLSRLERS
jgi:SAM-dependent methyltransferase